MRIVLLRTQFGRNLGAVARALNNFGMTRLVLAELGNVCWNDVNQTSVRSKHVTEAADRVASLEEAIAGCTYVVGTTMRSVAGRRAVSPSAAAQALAARSETEEVALVFGEERIGLTNDDLLRCHDTSVIPTAELPSLNLAQAVVVYAYELNRQLDRARPTVAPGADEADYAGIGDALRTHMGSAGFADPDRPRHGVLDLVQTLKRAGLTPREARLWRAVLSGRASPEPDGEG